MKFWKVLEKRISLSYCFGCLEVQESEGTVTCKILPNKKWVKLIPERTIISVFSFLILPPRYNNLNRDYTSEFRGSLPEEKLLKHEKAIKHYDSVLESSPILSPMEKTWQNFTLIRLNFDCVTNQLSNDKLPSILKWNCQSNYELS